jgi:hypothetical protein
MVTMKQFILLWCLFTFGSTVLVGQDRYPRLLEKVDVTKIWHTTPGIIPENNMVYDPIVADIINQTNLDSLISYVRILSGEDSVWIGNTRVLIKNRGDSGGDLAADYLQKKLESYDLLVYDQSYSSTGRNVYAMQEGYLYPEKQFIICAHYDAVDVYCADDNATGVAAVIETARILSEYVFKYTLVYALWDEEEIGLVGSNYYASQAASNQDQIQGVLNMDMLAWDGNDDGLLDIHTQYTANSNNIANLMVIINWLYGLPLNPAIYNPGTWQSDHSSFWNYGYDAILLIEAYYGGDLNPYYHSIDDRIDKFNLPYFHNLSKLSIGTISTLLEATQDTLIASVTPHIGYHTYKSNIQIKGVNTHFEEGSGTQQVWLSMDQETIASDNFVVNSNTLLTASFQIPATASIGMWDVNVECSIDGILTKDDCFDILPPPAIIVVNPDSLVVSVLPGSTKTKTLTISNQGESNLNFEIRGGFSSTNYALQFDGVNGYLRLADANSLGLKNATFTVEQWIKVTNFDGYDEAVLGATDPGELHFTIRDEKPYLGFWGNDLAGNTLLTEGIWYHIAWRYQISSGEQAIFINGQLDKAESGHPAYQKNNILNIGMLENANYFTGFIDDFRIWNYLRTEADIQADMNKQLSGLETGLIGYWNFNEGTGTTTFNKTINANHGKLLGGVSWVNSTAPLQPGWLFMNADSVVCSPHSSIDIELLFDATELNTGDYFASIIINNSDPFNPTIVVPIHMKVSPTVGIEDDINIPLVFDLSQNYPNPFNPSTKIKYQIPDQVRNDKLFVTLSGVEESFVTIKIYDILGREVAALVNQKQKPGRYEVEFNSKNLTSGIYFYRLQAGEFVQTKKMILLK